MILVGAAAFEDYGRRHPHALRALRALNVLLRQAAWADREDLVRACGAVCRVGADGRAVLELDDARCQVALNINYELGVIRIVAVSQMKGTRGHDA
jgi:mRNA-degrading endonuclease HigB of HigAB toxin-antitoxin module